MERFEDWPSRMDRWLREKSREEHVYGRWDCALMAASHIDNLTGAGLFSLHFMGYSDAEGASEYLAGLGVDGLAGLAESVLGPAMTNKKKAQRGDIVTFDTLLGPALGIIDLSGLKIVALDPSKIGFIRLPAALSTAAWRV